MDDEEEGISEHVKLVKKVSMVGFILTAVTCGAFAVNLGLHTGATATPGRHYIAGSHPAFVNYVAADVHKGLSARPKLCDADIVEMACAVLNNETVEAYGSDVDSDPRYIHAVELSEVLSVSKASVIDMFTKLDLSNMDQYTAEAYAVSCQELCEKLVASFPARAVPSMSDVGCYWPPEGLASLLHQAPICDVDLSPHRLANITFKDKVPGKEKTEYLESNWMEFINPDSPNTDTIDSALDHAANPSPIQQQLLSALDYPNMTSSQLRMSTIHLFRIFPAMNSRTQDGKGLMAIFAPNEPERQRLLRGADEKIPKIAKGRMLLNGEGDDSCAYARDGKCDYDTYNCALGTDCTDCRDCNTKGDTDDTCEYSRDGACDEPPQDPFYCYAGTDCTDCGTCTQTGDASRRRTSSGGIPDWKQKTLQLAVRAQAVCNQALTSMASRQIPSVVTTWFGNNWDFPTRQEIKRVVNGVKAMLDNVDYIYPGDQCTPNTYAYVYPNSPYNKNSEGKFVFHLCDYYMKVNEEEQIETLLHEGSHHVAMRTDDSDWDGTTMYGRPLCKQVATVCSQGNQDACAKARKNADSFCYFINDAAKATEGVQPEGRRRRTVAAAAVPTSAPADRRRRSSPVRNWWHDFWWR